MKDYLNILNFQNIQKKRNKIIKKIENADSSKYENWVITLKKSDTSIGNISVNEIEKKHNYCNVGYVNLDDYWGNGYASDALKIVSNYLLDSGYYLV